MYRLDDDKILYIESYQNGIEIYKTLGSEVRMEILRMILENEDICLGEMASRLNITNSALSVHMKRLEDCGIIEFVGGASGHRNKKKCKLCIDKIVINF